MLSIYLFVTSCPSYEESTAEAAIMLLSDGQFRKEERQQLPTSHSPLTHLLGASSSPSLCLLKANNFALLTLSDINPQFAAHCRI